MALTRPRASQIYNLDYKQATRVVTVSNITLAGGAPNQVDGVNLSTNDRILVTGQSTAAENGLYFVTTVGSGSDGTWERTGDANTDGEIDAGMIVMVTEGLIYADTQWKLITDNPIDIGVTGLIFTQNYSANSISGGSSNVTVYSNANVTISSAGTPDVLTISSTGTVTLGTASATGNIVGDYILGNGSQLTGLPEQYGNANVAAYLPTYTGNITADVISTTGNITGNYILGNGSQLTGIATTSIYNGTSNVSVDTANGNVSISASGTPNVAVFSTGSMVLQGAIGMPKTINSNVAIANNVNAMLLGPMTFADGVGMTVPDDSTVYIYTQ